MSGSTIVETCASLCDDNSGSGKGNGGGNGVRRDPLEPPDAGWPSQRNSKCDEHTHVACRIMRAEEDNGRLLASIRLADDESRRRDENLHAVTAEMLRTQTRMVEMLRHVQDDQYAIKRALELLNA